MEVKNKIDKGDNFILLDVRSRSEWEINRIEVPQIRRIPIERLRDNLGVLPGDIEIITMCQASVRAYQAQRILDGAGFKDVKFMDGSMIAWPYEISGVI